MRELGTPEDIVRYWVGHAGERITDRYSKLAENVELRKEWALRAGLGFSLDHLGKPGTQHGKPSVKLPKSAKPLKPDPRRVNIKVKHTSVKRRKPIPSSVCG